jgi:thiol-disulfide isomerase/thioredoxin
MRRVLHLLSLVLVAVVMAACAPTSPEGGTRIPQAAPADIDVDTPTLRRLRREAGLEPCRAGTGHNDLPAVTLPCLGGGPDVRLDQLEGPLVVNVWASWCGPCRRELPFYQQVSQEYAGQLQVVGIDITDPQTEKAMELLTDTGVTYVQVADPGDSLRGKPGFPRLMAVPRVLFVDADGRVTHGESLEVESVGQLRDLVSEHLHIDPPASRG